MLYQFYLGSTGEQGHFGVAHAKFRGWLRQEEGRDMTLARARKIADLVWRVTSAGKQLGLSLVAKLTVN